MDRVGPYNLRSKLFLRAYVYVRVSVRAYTVRRTVRLARGEDLTRCETLVAEVA